MTECHELIPLADAAGWSAALDGVEHAFAHTWGSCHALQLTTGLPTSLYRYESGGTRIVCPLVERTFAGTTDVFTPFGFSGFAASGEPGDFAERWLAFARRRGWTCGYIGLNPLLERPGLGRATDLFEHNEIYVLDLEQSEEELWARLSRNRRRQLRAWPAGGARITWDRADVLEFLIRHAGEFFHDRQASSALALAPATWRALADLPDTLVLGAETGGRLVAALVGGYTAAMGDLVFNVSVDGGREASAALLWAGAQRLRELGVPRLNLGGGVRPGDGVAAFKRRFGPRALPLRSLKQVYDPAAFEGACRRAGVDPDRRAGYFPPYHQPPLA